MVRGSTHEGAEWTGEQQGTKAQAQLARRRVFPAGEATVIRVQGMGATMRSTDGIVPQSSEAACNQHLPNEGGITGITRSSLNETGVFN
jgi:hypothetical protein